jgi:undecaprenyl diphosphate synthase
MSTAVTDPAGQVTVPRHLGLIMDGNRRWAKEQGQSSLQGHAQGQVILHDAVIHAVKAGVTYVSAYAFSTENWNRSNTEVTYLMQQFIKALHTYLAEFKQHSIKLVVIGSRTGLSRAVVSAIDRAEKATAQGTKATVAICFNYGGHQEIVDAVHSILNHTPVPKAITPDMITQHLYQPELPPLDLIIRTSGEERISNFMLWRSAYSELMFRPEYWPDFTPAVLDECLVEYTKRQRRFGG